MPIEALEQRVVLAATSPVSVLFNAGTLTLVSTTGSDSVVVKAGATFTDVTTNGRFLVRLNGVDSASITTIDYTGDGGTDSLSVSGISTDLSVTLSNVEKLQLNSGKATVASTTAAAGTLTLVTSTVNGALDLTADGAIIQSGKLLVSGNTSLTAQDTGATTNFNITLATAGNSFGTIEFTGANVQINEAGPTELAASTATGTLVVTSSGAITDGGTLTITGNATITSNGNSIFFNDSTSTFGGTLNLKGTTISVDDNDASGTALGSVTATGNFTLTSSGAVSHSTGNVVVGGLASITAGGTTPTISVSSGSNNFGSLSLSGSDVTITEKSATDITSLAATGNLSITSSGALTDTGVLTVGGTTSLTAKGNTIALDSATNTFASTITFNGGNVSITDSDGATALLASTAKGDFKLLTTGTGAGVSQSGALTISGRLTVDADNDAGTDLAVTLTNSGNKFGSVSVLGAAVSLREADATDLFDTTASGAFSLVYAGNVTDSGVLNFATTTSITPSSTSKSIVLDTAANALTSTITLTGTSATIVNTTTSVLGATTLTGSYTLDSTGAVSQAASTTISVTGALTIDANAASVAIGTQTSTTANFGSVGVTTTSNVSIDEDSATNLANSTVTGNYTLTSTAAIIDSGTLVIGDKFKATAGTTSDIILDSVGSTFGGSSGTDLELAGKNIAVLDNDSATKVGATTATAGTLKITSSGPITDTGVITVTGTNKATFDATGDDITLDQENVLGGAVSFFGNAVSFTRTTAAALDLGTSNVDSLTLNVNGVISDSGTLTVNDALTANTSDGGGTPTFSDVTLNSGANTFGSLVLSAQAVIINEFGDTDLGASTVASLMVTSSKGITDSGTLVVGSSGTGNTTLTADGGEIELNDASSTFAGTVALKGTNIEIDDNDSATVLGVVNASGTFTLTATGAVTQTGGVVASGDVSVSGTTITLDETGGVTNNFGTLAFTGSNVSIKESSNTDLNSSSASGTLTIVSAGHIEADATDTVTAGSTTDLMAGAAGDQSITLDNTSNAFGDLKLQASDATIRDTTGGTKLLTGTTVANLTLNTTGAITQDTGSTVIVTDTLSATATTDITLDGAGNEFNRVSVNGTNATLTDSDDGTVLLTSVLTGNFMLTNTSGSVTDADNAILTFGDAGTDTTTISAAGNIILNNVDSIFGTVILSGVNIELHSYGTATITVLTLGNIAASGTLTIRTFNFDTAITQDAAATISSGGNAFFFAAGVLTLNPANTYGGTDNQFFGDAGSSH